MTTSATRTVALIGNPNVGKTSLFNRLTGARAHVGNYPGITVERREANLRVTAKAEANSLETVVTDLPGAYSLNARSGEEQIAIDATLGWNGNRTPDLVVAVIDPNQLIRNLYLVTQLVELNVPLVLAVNMIDEVDDLPLDAIGKCLGLPLYGVSARTGEGLDELSRGIESALIDPPRATASIDYTLDDNLLADVMASLPAEWKQGRGPAEERALAIWALMSVDEDDELERVPSQVREACRKTLSSDEQRKAFDLAIVAARYQYLDALIAPLLGHAEGSQSANATAGDAQEPDAEPVKILGQAAKLRARSDRIDSWLLHPVMGFLIFVGVMLAVFQALFSWANPAIELVETLFSALGNLTRSTFGSGAVSDFLVDGVIAGVGNVVVFLPQIMLLFLFVGALEDSGYMARAAYLMDRLMRSLGLHGRAFVPMLSGCACAVPAIMATRTMERRRDRLLTMLVIPLMTCSARLPVYTLIIAAVFPVTVGGWLPVQGFLMVFMYVFSTVMALLAAAILGRTVVKGRRIPLLLELPPYRVPRLRSVLRQVLERALVFLKEAGTVILVCTAILWVLLSYPKPDRPQPPPPREVAAAEAPTLTPAARASIEAEEAAVAAYQRDRIRGSYGGQVGRAMEPAIRPLGFDWKLGIGLLGAFAAREVFVSTLGIVYGVAEADEESIPLRQHIKQDRHPDGSPIYTPLTGLSLMIFFALACQCMSTLAVVKRETQGYKWPAFLFVYMTALAYGMSFLVFQVGKLLGFS